MKIHKYIFVYIIWIWPLLRRSVPLKSKLKKIRLTILTSDSDITLLQYLFELPAFGVILAPNLPKNKQFLTAFTKMHYNFFFSIRTLYSLLY